MKATAKLDANLKKKFKTKFIKARPISLSATLKSDETIKNPQLVKIAFRCLVFT
jgi:hypothetical protein